MATPKSTNSLPTGSKTTVRIDSLEKKLPTPQTQDEALRRDLFRWPGTPENAALAELATLERDDFVGMVAAAVHGLEASVMYERLSDETYRTQQADADSFTSLYYPEILMHARLFVAGRLAERLDRQRRKRSRR